MKSKLLILLTSLIGFLMIGMETTIAQVTIDESTLITPGFRQKIDRDISTVLTETSVSSGGIFDFSDLLKVTQDIIEYQDADNGAKRDSFPNANILVENITEQRYMRQDNNGLYFLGTAFNNIPLGFPAPVLNSSDELPVHEVPLNYGDANNSQASFYTTFSGEALPDSLLDQIGFEIDSFRVALENERDMEVVNYGTLKHPDGESYEVLKVREAIETKLRFFAKVPIFGWTDVTSLVKQIFPQIETFFQDGTITTYQYYSNGVQGPLLTYQLVGGDTISNFQFRNDLTTSLSRSEPLFSLSAIPNPVSLDHNNVSLKTSYNGHGFLDIYDVQGRGVIVNRPFANSINIKINTSQLNSGLFIVVLKDENGKVLAREKIILED